MKTNYIEQAIRKAEEHSWKSPLVQPTDKTLHQLLYGFPYPVYQAWLDPSFWQSLGKSLKWSEPEFICITDSNPIWGEGSNKWQEIQKWRAEMHRFVEEVAAGKDAESYFKEILQ